jgi:hypothetical protein
MYATFPPQHTQRQSCRSSHNPQSGMTMTRQLDGFPPLASVVAVLSCRKMKVSSATLLLAAGALEGTYGFMGGGILAGTGSFASGGSAAAHLGGLNPANALQRRAPASSQGGFTLAPSKSARRGCSALRMDADADLREAAEFGFVHKSGCPCIAPCARCRSRRGRMHASLWMGWKKGR